MSCGCVVLCTQNAAICYTCARSNHAKNVHGAPFQRPIVTENSISLAETSFAEHL